MIHGKFCCQMDLRKEEYFAKTDFETTFENYLPFNGFFNQTSQLLCMFFIII